jgi:hypothetical protein
MSLCDSDGFASWSVFGFCSELSFGAFESSPNPASWSFGVISDLIPSSLTSDSLLGFSSFRRGFDGDDGSALTSFFDFAGVACLLKNDLIPSERSDTGCINVGESFPIFPTSGGTG